MMKGSNNCSTFSLAFSKHLECNVQNMHFSCSLIKRNLILQHLFFIESQLAMKIETKVGMSKVECIDAYIFTNP